MKKLLLGAFFAMASLLTLDAAPLAKIAVKSMNQQIETKAAETKYEIPYFVTGLFDTKEKIPNHYIILSSSADAAYDKNTGDVNLANGILLTLDLTNFAAQDGKVKAGTYLSDTERSELPEDLRAPMFYNHEFTMAFVYQNNEQKVAVQFKEPIVITEQDGVYDVTATISQQSENGEVEVLKFHFNGRMPITNVNEKQSPYAQLKRNVEGIDLNKGGIAFYQGVTDYSNQGVSYINLYSTDFDASGRMASDGWMMAIMVAHKRVVRKHQYDIFPGTYTMSKNLSRYTWYPCRDVNYNTGDGVITTQFGSFIRVRETKNGQVNYTYGYLADGTFDINYNDDGTYSGTLDAVTDLGYKVKVKFSGDIELNTDNAQLPSVMSTLTDDVAMTFEDIKARVYHRGILGGCRNITLDFGSRRSGVDPDLLKNGGGIIRLEFLMPQGTAVIKSGTYPMQELKWNAYELSIGARYTPNTLNQFRWSDSGGDLDGTVYIHFAENRTLLIMDGHAPIIDGKVEVQTDDYVNYIVDLDLYDDAGFNITGRYDGPIEYFYDREALEKECTGIESAVADGDDIKAVVESGSIILLNGGNKPVALYNINGMKVAEGTADQPIAVSSLAKGVYVLKVADKTLKIAL